VRTQKKKTVERRKTEKNKTEKKKKTKGSTQRKRGRKEKKDVLRRPPTGVAKFPEGEEG